MVGRTLTVKDELFYFSVLRKLFNGGSLQNILKCSALQFLVSYHQYSYSIQIVNLTCQTSVVSHKINNLNLKDNSLIISVGG